MSGLAQLLPADIWFYFNQICAIPRMSKNEQHIIAYLKAFAAKHNLPFKQDAIGNVLILKPATLGLNSIQSVVLQSHMDMVCEKNADTVHDFESDAIKPFVDGDWVRAQGTTLGADDGIGMAAQLALLASTDVAHGALECLFTVDEETGLTGAHHLEPNFLTASILLNLDSEDEGQLFIGCAGGKNTIATFPIIEEPLPQKSFAIKVSVSGLQGGHSGDDIDKGRGNAIKILNRYLYLMRQDFDLQLVSFDGGNLSNAIAREAVAIAVVPSKFKETARIEFNCFLHDIQEEFKESEPHLTMKLESVALPEMGISSELSRKIILTLYACPHGVIRMSRQIDGLVETSTNLASVKMNNHQIVIVTSQRSDTEECKIDVVNTVSSVFTLANAQVTFTDGYPGWKPDVNSPILNVAKSVYQSLFSVPPQVRAIHAGLECGLFLQKYPNLDMISFGPTIKGAHSPQERLSISSVQKFWDYLTLLLKAIPEVK